MPNLFFFISDASTEVPSLTEYAWDFDAGDFILDKGKFVVVTGVDAARIQIRKALSIPRFQYLAYSWNYGHEFDALVGHGMDESGARSEVRRYAMEALEPLGYVTDVVVESMSMVDGVLTAELVVKTLYGEVTTGV